MITVMNYIYTAMAYALTTWECHQTQSEHENQLTLKIAVFQLLNTFFGLTYTAFIKSSLVILGSQQFCQVGAAGAPDCLYDMQQQLGILIATRFVFTVIFELLLPLVFASARSCLHACRSRGSPERRAAYAAWRAALAASPLETARDAAVYDVFTSYLNLMLLFGFATLYVVALPLAPAFVFVAIALNLYLDRNFILNLAARPLPEGACSLGSWLLVFDAISYACTVTNLAVVVFSNPDAPVFGFAFSFTQRLVFFIAAEHVVLGVKFVLSHFIAEVTPATLLQAARQEYLASKLVEGVKDVVVSRRRGMPETSVSAARSASVRHVSVAPDAVTTAVPIAPSWAQLLAEEEQAKGRPPGVDTAPAQGRNAAAAAAAATLPSPPPGDEEALPERTNAAYSHGDRAGV